MHIVLNGNKLCLGNNYKDIPMEIKNEFYIIGNAKEDDEFKIYESKGYFTINRVVFWLHLYFYNNILTKIILVAVDKQEDEEYSKIRHKDDLHNKWLEDNYGEPDAIKRLGYTYKFKDGKIYSENDPRSGSDQIFIEVNNI